MHRASCLLLVASAACSVDLGVAGTAEVQCLATEDCPGDLVCLIAEGTCVLDDGCLAPIELGVEVALPTPTNITLTPGTGEITIDWVGPAGATFELSRNRNDEGWLSLRVDPSTTYVDTDLASDSVYLYRVATVEGTCSSLLAQSDAAYTPPIAPVAMTLQRPSVGDFLLQWIDANTREANYRVEIVVEGASTVIDLGPDASSYLHTATGEDLFHEFRVSAIGVDGQSSTEAVLGAFSGVTATQVGNPVLYAEDFDSFSVGADPTDWTDIADGVASDVYGVSQLGSRRVFSTNTMSGSSGSYYDGLGATAWANYSMEAWVQVGINPLTPVGPLPAFVGVAVYVQDPVDQETAYRFRTSLSEQGFHIAEPGGESVAHTGRAMAPFRWHKVRVDVESRATLTEVRAKMWELGAGEPPQWQAIFQDASAQRLSSGTVGLYTRLPDRRSWDNIVVRQIESAISIGDAAIVEGEVAVLDITLDAPLVKTLNFAWSVVPSSALAGEDFVFASAPVSLPAGTVSHRVVIPTLQDDDNEGPEAFLVALSGFTDLPVRRGIGFVAILDDDDGPLLLRESFDVPSGPRVPWWVDFTEGFGTEVDDAPFSVVGVDGEQVLQREADGGEDRTSYFLQATALGWSNYEFTGRIFVDSSGILSPSGGVVFYGQAPGSSHATYGFRHRDGETFQLFAEGTAFTGGTTDSGVMPIQDRWYRFKIQVEDTGTETQARARVWEEATAEPVTWQVDASDDSATRLTAGTIGVWSGDDLFNLWDDFEVQRL